MATLNNTVQAFIVQGLARYQTPTEVAESVSKEFGITVERQQVAKYDPTKVAGKNLAQKWKELFEECRAKFNEDILAIPIASKAYRLQVRQGVLEKALKSGNMVLVNDTLEQAAKEVGDIYVNKSRIENEITESNATPVQVVVNVKDARKYDNT